MPTLNIHLDPTVIAHLANAGNGDTVNISIALGEKTIEPAAVTTKPTGPLAPLMKAGLLEAGEELAFHQRRAKRTGRATVTADGQLIVEGHPKPLSSPSKAAQAVTGNVINGWTLWRTEGGSGPTLDDLRKLLEERG